MTSDRMRDVVHGIAFGKASKHAWWESKNVVGLCFAPKLRRGRLEDVTLQVHVKRKRALEKIPERLRVPETIEHGGVRSHTDVHEVGEARVEVLVSAARPSRPGYSVGHVDGGSGTLGCVVRARDTGEQLGLSCAHVVGLGGEGDPGDRVLVPSRPDAAAIGKLGRARYGTLVHVAAPSADWDAAAGNVDAATFRPDAPAHLRREIALVDVAPSGIVDDVAVGARVKKVGAATELTWGEVRAVHWLVMLPYPRPDGTVEEVWFADQIGVTRCSAPGDSGALMLDDATNAAVGMHVGSTDTLSVCAPMRKVLDAVACDLG